MPILETRPQLGDIIPRGFYLYRVTAIAAPIVVATLDTIPDGEEPLHVEQIKIFTIGA